MSADQKSGALPPALFRLGGGILLAVLAGWLFAWIFSLGSTLINDEYAAIDYFYRLVRDRQFYPTPDKLHKPLSVLLGFFSWVSESPLGYEAVTAVTGVIFIGLVYATAAGEWGRWPALLAAAAAAVNPEVMYYSATGSTVLPFCALSFLGLLAVLRRKESGRWLWVYAVSFFLAGLLRPEAWLFGIPLLVWWWPGKDRRKWARVAAAGTIFGLAPLIWFGKDYLINGDFLHGIKVATRDKAVGTGAPYTFWQTLNFFWIRIPNEVSTPVAAAGVGGALVFLWKERVRGLLHPFLIFPALISAYVFLIVYLGVYPVQRYWYFDSVFALLFCVYLVRELIPRLRLPPEEMIPAGLFFVGLFAALGFIITRPESTSPDGRWLLAGAALLAAAAVFPLVRPGLFKNSASSLACLGLIVLFGLAYPLFLAGYYRREVSELRLEARKQKEMTAAAAFLNAEIPPGRGDRILIPSRRNEQLNWLFRKREIPETVTFREAFYLKWAKNIDFLKLHPDWIVFIPHDFQFWGPDKMFGWLEFQDETELEGVIIKLRWSEGLVRVFQVMYPPGHPPKSPLPPIP